MANFDTWGPFVLRDHSETAQAEFWAQVDAAHTSLGRGVGIYLVFSKGKSGEDVPRYVGQTYDGFWNRWTGGHLKTRKFEQLLLSGPITVFLLALAKAGNPLGRREEPNDREDQKLLDWLEVDLIDHCQQLNERLHEDDLLNIQHARFLKKLWVGGYRGNSDAFAEPAYLELAKRLKIRGADGSSSR